MGQTGPWAASSQRRLPGTEASRGVVSSWISGEPVPWGVTAGRAGQSPLHQSERGGFVLRAEGRASLPTYSPALGRLSEFCGECGISGPRLSHWVPRAPHQRCHREPASPTRGSAPPPALLLYTSTAGHPTTFSCLLCSRSCRHRKALREAEAGVAPGPVGAGGAEKLGGGSGV